MHPDPRPYLRTALTLKSLANVAGLAAACCLSVKSQGQTLSWNAIAGGSAGTAANWTPAQVPGVANLLVWNLPNTFTTTFPGTVSQTTSHTFKRGIVTLSMSSPHTTSSFVRVGDVSGDSATTILSSGTLHAGTGVAVGNASGAVGVLTVDNEGTLLDTAGAGSDIVVGNAGDGTFTISDGASAVVADDVVIGAASTAVGHVTVTGTGGLPIPIPPSTLDLTGAGKDVIIGQSGDGFLSVLSGGRVNADEMFVGLNTGSNGSVTVGGVGGILNATAQINVATSLHLGDNPGIGLGAGSSTFTLNSGGVVNVAGSTRIGDPAGVGSGTLSVNGGVFTTGSLIATDSGGFLNMFNGQVVIDGGSFQPRNDVFSLSGSASGSPALVLENGASCTLSNNVAPFETLVVGQSSSLFGCTFAVFNDSNLTISAGDVILGNLSGSNGQLNVRTGGTVTTPASRFLVVGDAGEGSVFVQAGAQLTSGTVNLGRTNTGTGLVEVSGDGSVWNIAGALAIGGTTAGAFGTGSFEIQGAPSGSVVNITSGDILNNSVMVWGTGDSLTIGPGAAMVCDGHVRVKNGAVFTLAGGDLTCNGLFLEGSNYLLNGALSGTLLITNLGGAVELTGDLTITTNGALGGFLSNDGFIEVGDHVLSVPSAQLNNAHIGTSGRISGSGSAGIASGKTLSGDGIVNIPVNNGGSILSQGSGLTFTKIISGIGQGISGNTITFGDGGGFTGSGVFSTGTPITALDGSVITATGNLTMGSASSSVGFSGAAGRINVGTHSVTLNDSSQAVIGDVEFPILTPGSASIRCTTGLGVHGRVFGSGILGGDFDSGVVISGTLTPGNPGTVGTISLGGNTILNASSHIQLDILNGNTHDVINTLTQSGPNFPFTFQSNMTLGGTLELRVNPTHTPARGEEHTIILCSGAFPSSGHFNSAFQTVIAPPYWHIVERTAAFGTGPDRLVAIYCPADFNGDGTVDFFDYLDFVDAFSANAASADFNIDGTIDFFDYLDFVDGFSVGC